MTIKNTKTNSPNGLGLSVYSNFTLHLLPLCKDNVTMTWHGVTDFYLMLSQSANNISVTEGQKESVIIWEGKVNKATVTA